MYCVVDSASRIHRYPRATGVVNVFSIVLLRGVAVYPLFPYTTLFRSDAALTLNANGSVDVAAGAPAGTYILTYQICENNNPANCNTTIVAITLDTPIIDAVVYSA